MRDLPDLTCCLICGEPLEPGVVTEPVEAWPYGAAGYGLVHWYRTDCGRPQESIPGGRPREPGEWEPSRWSGW